MQTYRVLAVAALLSSATLLSAPTAMAQVIPMGPEVTLDNWANEESERSGLEIVAVYDDSGPAAWDPAEHPLVYLTSEGRGYNHRPSKTDEYPGLQLIDANTHEIIAAPQYDFGWDEHFTPHNAAASPDGKWFYTYTIKDSDRKAYNHAFMIINAKTLKLRMVLTTTREDTGRARFHHMQGFKDWMGRDRVLVEAQNPNGGIWILDPNDDNRVVRAITTQDIGFKGHPYSNVDPDGKTVNIGLESPVLREEPNAAQLAKFDLETGEYLIIPHVGAHTIGKATTADGKFTYVADGTTSTVYKIDNEELEVVGETSAGVAGPYGAHLNWDESLLYTMGKGEGSHNTGGVVGVIDLKTFRPTRTEDFNQPLAIGGAIIDHGILHPDPEKNELWISSAGTWETIILDLNTHTVKARIPSPHGGDTHNGAFIRYNPDFTGELMADMMGPKETMREIIRAKVAEREGS